jgi:ketosteroid isomerase-like protein
MSASPPSPFREALGRHLLAIEDRDLATLADTVAPDEIVLIMADGRMLRRTDEFLDAHRGWFASRNWKLAAKPIHIHETPQMGVAVMHLDYRESPPGGPERHEESILTLIFEPRGGKWVMVQDQNTPIRDGPARPG